MAGTNPAIDDRPFGMSECTIGPSLGHASQFSPPIRCRRNSGLLILGIVTLHRSDWPRTELDRTNFVPVLAAPNKRPYPKGTFLPS